MTESWALLPLAGAHYACWSWSKGRSQQWCAAVIGVSFASILWLRPNMGAYPLVAMGLMLYEGKRRGAIKTSFLQLAGFCGAVLGVSAVIVVPLYRWGVFHDFVAAYFGYNASYSRALSFSSRWMHTQILATELFASALAILGVAGWIFVLMKNRRDGNSAGDFSLYLYSLIWSLPVELAAATLSGRDYGHYLLPLFLTLAVLTAWFLAEFEKRLRIERGRPVLLLALLLALVPLSALAYFRESSRSWEPVRPEYAATATYIQKTTKPNDRIIVVGGTDAASITFLARRLPASRFVYDYPLIDTSNPVAFEQRRQFMCELRAARPAVIVSANPVFAVLCASALNCPQPKQPSPLAEYGYNTQLLPELLKNFIVTTRPKSS